MSTPAGWYPDTQATGGERYWDGTAWTAQRRPTPDPGALNFTGLDDHDAWAMRWAWMFPLVGFIQGLKMLDKQPARGAQIMITSVVVTLAYVVVIYLLTTN